MKYALTVVIFSLMYMMLSHSVHAQTSGTLLRCVGYSYSGIPTNIGTADQIVRVGQTFTLTQAATVTGLRVPVYRTSTAVNSGQYVVVKLYGATYTGQNTPLITPTPLAVSPTVVYGQTGKATVANLGPATLGLLDVRFNRSTSNPLLTFSPSLSLPAGDYLITIESTASAAVNEGYISIVGTNGFACQGTALIATAPTVTPQAAIGTVASTWKGYHVMPNIDIGFELIGYYTTGDGVGTISTFLDTNNLGSTAMRFFIAILFSLAIAVPLAMARVPFPIIGGLMFLLILAGTAMTLVPPFVIISIVVIMGVMVILAIARRGGTTSE